MHQQARYFFFESEQQRDIELCRRNFIHRNRATGERNKKNETRARILAALFGSGASFAFRIRFRDLTFPAKIMPRTAWWRASSASERASAFPSRSSPRPRRRRRRRGFRLAITCLTIASRIKEDSGSGIRRGRSLSYGRSRDRGEEGRLRFRRDRRRENRLELRKCARMTRRGGERGTGKIRRRASGGIAIAERLPKGARRKERERSDERATTTTTTATTTTTTTTTATATATRTTTTRRTWKVTQHTHVRLPAWWARNCSASYSGQADNGNLRAGRRGTVVARAWPRVRSSAAPVSLRRSLYRARVRAYAPLHRSSSSSSSSAPPRPPLGLPLTRCLSSSDVEEVDDACHSQRWG